MSWFDDLKTPRIKTQATQRASKVPEGLWIKCASCGEILQSKVLKDTFQVCPECDMHFRLSAMDRIAMHFRLSAMDRIAMLTDSEESKRKAQDEGPERELIFEEYGENLVSTDPLEFTDTKPYRDRLRTSAQNTGLGDAFVAGRARLDGIPYHLGVFEFKFMGGSMGAVVGEKICMVFEHALKDRIPAVVISASGGARMQEGIISLMQMARTSALIEELKREGIPFISVLTDPTTGGVAASFAMLGDVIIAEPKALIGFAGPRVIEQTIRQKLPEGFQRAEFLLQHGFVDRIVPRAELRNELKFWLSRLGHHTCKFPKGLNA